jgi:hypothetical protein
MRVTDKKMRERERERELKVYFKVRSHMLP